MAGTKKTHTDTLETITMGSKKHPKVFLSYAWSDVEHKEKVRLFADRLISKGVDVVLDVYDNKPGHELNHFMEKSVKDDSVTHVLVITDKNYAEKADARKGGVGTETQLISQEVYKEIDQTKVVPLVFARDEGGNPYLPVYMKSRHYIDFSDESQADAKFDELIRHLYDKPKHVKPPLGPVPDFEPAQKHTIDKLPIKPQSYTGPKTATQDLDVTVESLLSVLKKLRKPSNTEKPIDEKIIAGISEAQPYTNALFNELNSLLETDSIDDKKLVEKIDGILCRAKTNHAPLPGVSSWRESDYEHIGFIIHEIATGIIALLVKHRRYKAVHNLINRTYFYRDHLGELRSVTFNNFYQYMRSLDEYRNSRLKLNRASVAADIQKDDASKFDVLDFDNMRDADSLLYLLNRFVFPDNRYAWWFPRLAAYSHRGDSVIDPLGELISKTRANEIATMFGANNVKELIELHKAAVEVTSKIEWNPSWNFNVPEFTKMLPEKVAELP